MFSHPVFRREVENELVNGGVEGNVGRIGGT
jgi:hypothetical protein